MDLNDGTKIIADITIILYMDNDIFFSLIIVKIKLRIDVKLRVVYYWIRSWCVHRIN